MGVEAVPLRLAIVWRTGSLRCDTGKLQIASATCGCMKVHSCVAYARHGVLTRYALSGLFGVQTCRSRPARTDDDSRIAADQGLGGGEAPIRSALRSVGNSIGPFPLGS